MVVLVLVVVVDVVDDDDRDAHHSYSEDGMTVSSCVRWITTTRIIFLNVFRFDIRFDFFFLSH